MLFIIFYCKNTSLQLLVAVVTVVVEEVSMYYTNIIDPLTNNILGKYVCGKWCLKQTFICIQKTGANQNYDIAHMVKYRM